MFLPQTVSFWAGNDNVLFLKEKASLLPLMLKVILVMLPKMIAPVVFKNGRPRMIVNLSSIPVFTNVKSVGTYELPTPTHMFF